MLGGCDRVSLKFSKTELCRREAFMLTDRRSIIAGLALVVASPVVASAQTKADLGKATVASFADITSAAQFYASVLPRAELSLATSQLGIEKTVQKDAREFAGFEFGEAVTVDMVLKDLAAPVQSMDASAMTLIETMKKTPKGEAFDHAYIAFQLENHEYLRDLADAYLHNTVAASDPMEKQGRHLASLMLAVFKEHTIICKRINAELKA